MVLIIFVAALIIGPLAAQLGAAGGVAGPATFLANITGAAAGGLGGATVAGAGFTALGAAVTEAAFAGAIGLLAGASATDVVNGPYTGAASGYGNAVRPSEAANRSVYDGLNLAFDTPTIEGSKVRAVSHGAYGAACAPGATMAVCGGGSGVVPRADGGAQTSTSQFWRDNGKPMTIANPYRED